MTTLRNPPRGRSKRPDRGAHPTVDFINALHHTGDFSGMKFELRPWQEALIRKIFDDRGKPRYRKVFIGLPRKQGKTELAAAILLYLMFGTGRKGQRVFSGSGDHEQASLIYGAAASMIRQSPALSSVALTYDGYKKICCEPIDGVYKALSSDAATKHGLRPSSVFLDEVHVFPNRDLYNVLMSAFGATIDPFTLMITTAGWDRTSLCYELWTYARGVRDGLIDDPTFLPILYEAGPDDDWTEEETWRKAMPALGDFCQLDFIKEECKRAQQLPAYENTFRQLYLNQWTEQATRWIQVERWNQCGEPFDPAILANLPCYGGLDLGVTGDMSAYVRLFADGDGGYYSLPHFWAPENGKWRKEMRNRDRYEDWHRRGFLTFTAGESADHGRIEADIARWEEEHPTRQITADRAYATHLLSNLLNNHSLNVKGIPQGAVTMNEPMVKFEELILSGQIHHGGNPVLNWNIANAVVSRGPTGLMMLDKSQARERIDGLAALLNALRGAIDDPDNDRSVYEDRGIFIL